MRRVLIIASVLGCAGLAMAAEPANQQQAEFKFKFEPGRTIRQKMVTKSVGNLKLPGPLPEQKMQQTFEQVMTTRCRQVNPDGTALFDVTLGDIVMHQSVGAIMIDFDSRTWQPGRAAGSPVEVIGKIFSAMNGATLTVTVSDTGQPLKVEGLTEVFKKAVDQLGDDVQAKVVRQLFDQISSSIGDDNMSQQFQSLSRMCPPKKGVVKIGDKWDHTWSMKMPIGIGAMEGKGEYELVGFETVNGRPCAKIHIKETFKTVPAAKQSPKPAGAGVSLEGLLGRMKMDISSSGGDGTAYVDYEYGEAVKLLQTQTITITMSLAADPSDPEEATRKGMQDMTQRFRTSVSLELLNDEAGAEPKTDTKPANHPAVKPVEVQPAGAK